MESFEAGKIAIQGRALVVEDDPFMARAVKRELILMGFDVKVAVDGPEASRLVMTFCPEVIALDLGLPWLSGCGVLKKLGPILAEGMGKVIVISGGSDAEIMKALSLGASGYVRKPFEPELFRVVVQDIFSRKRVA